MKSKKFSAHRIVILLVLCIIATSCQGGTTFTIVPIREAEFREEHALPLDSLKIEEIIEFIADGGVHRDNGLQASVEHESFKRFLQLFTTEANLTYGAFKALPEVKEFIDPEKPVLDVIDARKEEGAKGSNRRAYRYGDFWFVFIIDTLFADGRPIRDDERKFSCLIVMQVLDREEKTK